MSDGIVRRRRIAGVSGPDSELVVAEEWHGALPPPEILQSYYEIGDGVGDQVMDLAKAGVASRRELTEKALVASERVLYALFGLVGLGLICTALVVIFVPWPESLSVFVVPTLAVGGMRWYWQRSEKKPEEAVDT